MKIRIANMKQLSHFILMLLLRFSESTQLDKDNYDIVDHMRKENRISSNDNTPPTSTISDKRNFSGSKNYTLEDSTMSNNAVISDRTPDIDDVKSSEYRDTCIDISDGGLNRKSNPNRVNDKNRNIIDDNICTENIGKAAGKVRNNKKDHNKKRKYNHKYNNNNVYDRNNEYPCNIKRINLKQQINEVDYIEKEAIDIYSKVPIIYEGLKDRNILLSYLASKYNLTSSPAGDVEVNIRNIYIYI
jgi:hypothetical protein